MLQFGSENINFIMSKNVFLASLAHFSFKYFHQNFISSNSLSLLGRWISMFFSLQSQPKLLRFQIMSFHWMGCFWGIREFKMKTRNESENGFYDNFWRWLNFQQILLLRELIKLQTMRTIYFRRNLSSEFDDDKLLQNTKYSGNLNLDFVTRLSFASLETERSRVDNNIKSHKNIILKIFTACQ